MISCRLMLGVAAGLSTSPLAAEILHYKVQGLIQKDAISDPVFQATEATPQFLISFAVDESLVLRVPSGTITSLPNFPQVLFGEDGFQVPAAALRLFSFRLSSGNARFGLEDVIGDPSSPGVIFVTGTLRRPTAIHVLLGNSRRGIFEVGIPECTPRCRLTGGVVIDQAGPFGRLSTSVIELAPPPPKLPY